MSRVKLSTEHGIATVTLNRPEVRNAFDGELIAELTAVFSGLDARAAVLRGAGKVFCAGADIDVMRASIDLDEAANRHEAEKLAAMFRAIDECPCPVVAAVHGAAMGGGIGLVTACDIVIVTDDVKLAFSEVKLGIVPAVISPFVIRKIGEAAARRWFLTGEIFGAEEARAMGLAHRVVAADGLDDAVADMCRALAKAGPEASRRAKRLIREVGGLPFDAAVAHGIATIAAVRTQPEAQEGLRAFLEKRRPEWGEKA